MHGPTHRLLGASFGLGLAAQQGWPGWQVGASVVLAGVTSNGRLSPDGDLYRGWRLADRLLPDEALGRGGPFQHRGITHWPGVAVAAGAVIAGFGGPWWGWALLAGWASHLCGDAVWGRAGAGRGPGIPLAPWWGHVGLGLDAGGWSEGVVRVLVLPAVLVWQSCLLAGVDPVAVVQALGR